MHKEVRVLCCRTSSNSSFYLLIYFMFLVPTVYTPDIKKSCKLKTILNHERIKASTGLWVEVYLHCKFKVSTEILVLSDAFQQFSKRFPGFSW